MQLISTDLPEAVLHCYVDNNIPVKQHVCPCKDASTAIQGETAFLHRLAAIQLISTDLLEAVLHCYVDTSIPVKQHVCPCKKLRQLAKSAKSRTKFMHAAFIITATLTAPTCKATTNSILLPLARVAKHIQGLPRGIVITCSSPEGQKILLFCPISFCYTPNSMCLSQTFYLPSRRGGGWTPGKTFSNFSLFRSCSDKTQQLQQSRKENVRKGMHAHLSSSAKDNDKDMLKLGMPHHEKAHSEKHRSDCNYHT
eukprot:1157796-Pelagomonas_calceolata.AAC.3